MEGVVPATNSPYPAYYDPKNSKPQPFVSNEAVRDSSELVQPARNKLAEEYNLFGKPKDLRYAHKVYGAALAPPWNLIWSEDLSISTDSRQNYLETAVNEAEKEAIKTDLKMLMGNASMIQRATRINSTALDSASKNSELKDAWKTHETEWRALRQHYLNLVPRDTLTSRLADTVLDEEVNALNMMQNMISARIRSKKRSYEFVALSDQLDLRYFKNDITLLARSIRRDDILHVPFARLVGRLIRQGVYSQGNYEVSIMQVRLWRQQIQICLQDMIGALIDLGRPIVLDTVESPVIGSVWAEDSSIVTAVPVAGAAGDNVGGMPAFWAFSTGTTDKTGGGVAGSVGNLIRVIGK
jgi:hypothetical protein